ncbi:hypothetical protein BDB00DRAFT_798639 [Zychaea mexicana]|uniref:uncharacterized protein n=1 Tax=Zychaea mexicana TaxID=64656 RepID=UPI0022FEA1D7|nr:uncharacterized protein BDB00DRAFT_798639 [Zychaea mexicana]KAI9498599.1 hypothetical protein BDB00DRAFT_798639 [Zychaea mexicana]
MQALYISALWHTSFLLVTRALSVSVNVPDIHRLHSNLIVFEHIQIHRIFFGCHEQEVESAMTLSIVGKLDTVITANGRNRVCRYRVSSLVYIFHRSK